MFIATLLHQIYSNVVPFVVLLGILVFVHELGHFLVARMCGVRVEVFSLGFGKKLFSYKKGDTTYCVSLIPLGGYVKMFGEQTMKVVEGDTLVPLTKEEEKVSFTHKNVWQRIAIVLAGPLMNFFFAIFVFSFIAQIGEETRSAIIAEVEKGSAAEQMGLHEGDKVLQVSETTIQSYEELQKALNLYKDKVVQATIETLSGEKKNVNLKITSIKNPNIFSSEAMIGTLDGVSALAKGSQIGVIANSEAYKLGFRTGDEITEIDGQKVLRWSQIESLLLNAAKLKSSQQILIKYDRFAEDEKNKTTLTSNVNLAQLSIHQSIKDFGFDSSELYLDQIVKGSPAEQADLKRFDKIIAINSSPIEKWEQVLNTIKSFDGKDSLSLTIIRDGATLVKKITPLVTSQMNALGQEDKRYTIGIFPMVAFAQPEMTVVKSASIFASVAKGFSRTWDISTMTVFSFVKLFQGEVSHKNIGGMISIGKAAKESFEMGLQSFLITMGILSVSLFILNLLPIPVLDGGHLVFYIIEVIKGSPLSVKKMEIAQQVGFVLLMGLMVLALFNDFTKFFFKT